MNGATPAQVAVTRRVLAELAAEQDQLGVELEASGLTDFLDRSEWLIAHRTPLTALAYEMREARRSGFRADKPSLAVEHAPRPVVAFDSLSVAKRHTARPPAAIDPLLQVALRVYDAKDAAVQAAWVHARAPRVRERSA